MDNLKLEDFFNDKIVLVTGGTGSFGNIIVRQLLSFGTKEIRVFSRDEKKQDDMRHEFSDNQNLRLFLGDVRDRISVQNVIRDVDVVFHAAALKQVHTCEFHPYQAVLTNVIGAQNVIDCSIEANVKRFIGISTDKAVEPVNSMGMSKALQEKLIISANYQNDGETIFSCVRYGNVLGSRGSVIPLFKNWIDRKQPVKITDRHMTRFLLTLSEAVGLVFKAVYEAKGGEIFVRKSPAHTIIDLAEVMLEAAGYSMHEYEVKEIGIRPGEKIHETLVSPTESMRVIESDQYFVILPRLNRTSESEMNNFRQEPPRIFRYSSDSVKLLNKAELTALLKKEGWITE